MPCSRNALLTTAAFTNCGRAPTTETTCILFGRGFLRREIPRMLRDAALDRRHVVLRPLYRAGEAFFQGHLRHETELTFRFGGFTKALARTVPRTRFQHFDRSLVASKPVD